MRINLPRLDDVHRRAASIAKITQEKGRKGVCLFLKRITAALPRLNYVRRRATSLPTRFATFERWIGFFKRITPFLPFSCVILAGMQRDSDCRR
jgi:hypothetical protein